MKAWTVVLAVLVLLTTFPAWSGQESIGDQLKEREGQIIGREDVGPEAVTRLDITTWDSELGEPRLFQVRLDTEVGWIIPSHHDYPADAEEQVGRTAGSVIGRRYGRLVSTSPKDFAELGVVDPSRADQGLDSEGQGTRVSLFDADGATIVDLIVGDHNPAKSGARFVREAGSNAVYSADIDVVFSTRFTDWVNRDLVDIGPSAVSEVVLDRYSVDEVRGVVDQQARRQHRLVKAPGDDGWNAVAGVPQGKVLDTDVAKKLVTRACNLQLQGVRPFPADYGQLQRFGLFVGGSQEKQELLGNMGALKVTTVNGFQYQYYFGEIAPGTGLALSAGNESAENEGGDDEAPSGDNRYVAVVVDYRPEFDRDYQEALKPTPEAEKSKEAEKGQEKKTDPAAAAAAIAKQREERLKDLNSRYQSFFYVIDNASFFELRPDEETLFTDPPKEEEAAETAPPAPAPAPTPSVPGLPTSP